MPAPGFAHNTLSPRAIALLAPLGRHEGRLDHPGWQMGTLRPRNPPSLTAWQIRSDGARLQVEKPIPMMAMISTTIVAVLLLALPIGAAPVPVRYLEGTLHGFVVVRTANGSAVASGDLFQVNKGEDIQSRMVFRFKDGSIDDETVTYTQRRVFTMQSYQLVRNGPAFADDMEISLKRSGTYRVKTKGRKDGKVDVIDGRLDLHPDVYNGMVIVVVRNLPEAAGGTVHFVAFTPKPRLMELQIIPESQEKVRVGEGIAKTTRYLLKPRLGWWLELAAKLLGKLPPDSHAWITHDAVAAFLRADEPLSESGPIYRIELTAPRWPEQH